MAKIKGIYWTPKAKNDIYSIAEYISKDSEYNAKIFIRKLLDSTVRLNDFPFSGKIVPEYNDPNIREIIFKKYRLIYRIKEDYIHILNVFHGSKLLE